MHPHLRPRPAVDLLREVAATGNLVVGVAQYSPTPIEVERVSVIAVDKRPHVRADAWMAPPEIKRLVQALSARRGETDAMYATRWSLLWTAEPTFCLWDRRGKRAWIENGRLCLRRDALEKEQIRAVEAYVEPGAVERGVRILLVSGKRRVIARQREWIVKIDPTYDHIDLFVDASWARSLARSLADALHIPLELSPAFGS
jgi:hypothetical protein